MNQNDYDKLQQCLTLYHKGYDPELLELTERMVFPYLIPAQPSTGRKSRSTGILLGRPTPRFVRHGRSIRYRLSDVMEWLSDGSTYGSTSDWLNNSR